MIESLVNALLTVAAGVAVAMTCFGAWLACAVLAVVGREGFKAITQQQERPSDGSP